MRAKFNMRESQLAVPPDSAPSMLLCCACCHWHCSPLLPLPTAACCYCCCRSFVRMAPGVLARACSA